MVTTQSLIDSTIHKVEIVHDYTQIEFSNGEILTILNNYIYDGSSILNIRGKSIKCIEQSTECIFIFLNDGSVISVGLKDGDFNGPEAMILKSKIEPITVWR